MQSLSFSDTDTYRLISMICQMNDSPKFCQDLLSSYLNVRDGEISWKQTKALTTAPQHHKVVTVDGFSYLIREVTEDTRNVTIL